MKTTVLSLLVLFIFAPIVLLAGEKPAKDSPKNCGCDCCEGKATCCCQPEPAASTATDAAKRHPLKGVIVDLLVDQAALLVKHEAIPGYMSAMTMMFKVDAGTLKAAIKGQAITGTLVEREDGYWLEDVQPAAPGAK
jgi:protein SCO1/2